MAKAMHELNVALHDLHESAGLPSLSDLERSIGRGVASRSRIHEAFVESRLPAWGLVELLVEELAKRVPGGPGEEDETQRFHDLWLSASRERAPYSSEAGALASTMDALLVGMDWLIEPQLTDPLKDVIDLALTEAGMDNLLISRSESAAGGLLVLRLGVRTGAHLVAAFSSRLDALFSAHGVKPSDHENRIQLRLIVHAGMVRLDGQTYTGTSVTDLRAHQGSALVQNLAASTDSVIIVAADAVAGLSVDQRNAGESKFRWSSVLNRPEGASPLRLWVRTTIPVDRDRVPRVHRHHRTERIGISVASRAIHQMGWLFREQAVDLGIDAQIEIVHPGNRATGRLIAVVIKTGIAYFKDRRGEGWLVRSSHIENARYLLAHALPVVFVLVDPESEMAYWVHVTASSITFKGSRWEVVVPENQRLGPGAALSLREIAGDRGH